VRLLFDDLNFTAHRYEPFIAYGQSKTANILFAVEANRRWATDAITASAVHPGAIADTNLSRQVINSDATDLSDHRNGVAAYALDPANARHLWDLSQSMLA
jgi:NAD(P)-dependent dehydrogenase (short-subunit alcohol dehydrogenase family)